MYVYIKRERERNSERERERPRQRQLVCVCVCVWEREVPRRRQRAQRRAPARRACWLSSSSPVRVAAVIYGSCVNIVYIYTFLYRINTFFWLPRIWLRFCRFLLLLSHTSPLFRAFNTRTYTGYLAATYMVEAWPLSSSSPARVAAVTRAVRSTIVHILVLWLPHIWLAATYMVGAWPLSSSPAIAAAIRVLR